MADIKVPKSMCKAFLASNGLRVTPAATIKFEKLFREWSNKISVIATENAKEAKRKTIFPEDFNSEETENKVDKGLDADAKYSDDEEEETEEDSE